MTRPLCLVLIYVCAVKLPAQQKVNEESAILSGFDHRVADYVKIHKEVRSSIHGLKPTSSPGDIGDHEHKFAHRMREARPNAKQGDIFTPETAEVFRQLIAQTMKGSAANGIQASLRHDDKPAKTPMIRVNGRYPEDVPLPSTPPSVLMNLPPLPPELEYRVVGHALILRDQSASLIVDYIPNAIP